jgi:hypothetical protein
MGNYRYRVARGLRKQNHAFDDYEGVELRSEDFDDDEEYCQAIASHILELIKDDYEAEENDDDSN